MVGFRLSPPQLQAWSHSAERRAQCRIAMEGPTHRSEVLRAVQSVIERHESLRSRLVPVPGLATPLQLVDDSGEPEWIDDVLPGDALAAAEAVDRAADADVRAPSDGSSDGGAVRARLMLGSDRAVLVLTASGVFVDRRSLAVIFEDLAAALGGRTQDEVSLQYLDAAEWLHEQTGSDEARARMDAWLGQELAVAARLLTPFEPGTGAGSAAVRVPLDGPAAAAVGHLATRIRCSVTAVLLGAWQVLLWRLTGEERMVTALLSTSRGLDELQDVVGNFESPVPLLTVMEPARAFAALAKDLDEAWAEAPVDQFSFDGTRTTEPVPFTFARTELPAEVRAGGRRLAMEGLVVSPAGSLLHLDVVQGAQDELTLGVVHDVRRVSARHAERIAGQLASVVRAVVADPDAPVGDIGLADEEETARVLAQGTGERRLHPEPQLVHARFERWAAERPEALAAVCGGRRLTYGEVERRANRLAHALRARGVGPDVPVGLMTERSLEYVVGLLAVLKAGGAFVPLDPSLPAARLTRMIEDAHPAALLTGSGLTGPVTPHGIPMLDLDDAVEPDPLPDAPPAVDVRPDHLAYLIFTSGSTGRPKAVGVPHRAVGNYVAGVVPEFALPEDAVLGTLATTAADLGHTAVFGALCTGRSLFLAAPDEVLAADALVRRFREQPVDMLKIVPSHLAALLDAEDAAELLPSTCLVFGGEELPASLVERVRKLRPGLRVVNHYGPTETAVGALTLTVADGTTGQVPIGRPLPNYRSYVLDEKLRPVLEGAPGELYIGGSGVARGYEGQRGATAERFLPDPFTDEPGAVMYHTGDLVRQRPDGAVVFLGRADQQVKIRGHRVELREIEATLLRGERVSDAVAVVRSDGADPYLAAYIVARRSAHLPPAELTERLRAQLPDYMVPTALVVLPVLPLTPNGKVDRRALPAPDPDASRTASHVAPRTETESLLAQVWADILGCEKVGVHDDFFHTLGGNSLGATRVVARVRAATKVALQVATLFESSTVAQLAELIDDERAACKADADDTITPIERSGPLPLSYAQRRIWVLTQVDGANAAYNIPASFRISGPLDTACLVRALSEVLRRHEALRTNFATVDGVPAQIVREASAVDVPVLDVPAPDVLSRAQAFAARPFDLERDELFRAEILRVAPEEHVLLLCLHHIVSDGWSTAVLWQEIVTLYRVFRADQPSPLAPLAIQYADFASWQNQWLETDGIRPQLEYWTEQLRGLPALLNLPTDRPRPAVQGIEGATVPITLDRTTTDALRALAGERQSTMFMALLTAVNVLLSRYSSQEDIAVGTPIANRTRAEAEALVGCFFNTLVIRTDLSGDPSFEELLGRVREVTLAAQTHQDLPFERLVEALNPPRDPGHTPLFQALFVYQTAPGDGLDMDGLGIEPLALPGSVAKYDLTVDLVENDEGLTGRVEYRTDLFDAATIERLVDHFTELVRAIVREPATRIGEFTFLGEPERELVLSDWNRDYVARTDELFVADAFEARAKATPQATALVFGNRSLTYGELDREANRLARILRSRGVMEDVIVGLWTERSVEMVVAMLAVLKAGGAYVPMDPGAPVDRIAYMIEDTRLRFVVAPTARLAELPDGVELIAPETDADADGSSPVRALRPDHLAYVIYTSGSTGRPKGVMVAQRNLAGFFAAMDQRLGGSTPGTWLALTHYTFDISVLELLWTLTRGFKVVLVGEELVLSDARRRGSDRAVDFSLFYFASDAGERGTDKYRMLLDGARWADEHGFAAVWTPERHFGTFGGLYPNPGITAAAVAACTSRIGIRAGSLVLPLQNPLRVAEDWAVIDNLSGGRVGLSVASGWQPHDFALAPENFADRKEIMFRDLDVVRKLWRGEAVRTVSGTGDDIEVRTLPRPVQPELPVWITAAGNPETFRRAGAVGASLLTHLLGQSAEDLAISLDVYRTARREAGHAGEGHVTLMLHTFVSDDEEFVRRTVREPFKNYLRESVELVRPIARSRGLELEDLEETDLDALLDHAFDRYYGDSGLFGTPEQCASFVGRLRETGVDEIACLIDFGVGTEEVLASFEHLDTLRRTTVLPVPGEAPREDVAGLIELHGVTHLQCTPSLAALLVADDDARRSLRELDWMLVGGEALPPALAGTLSATVGGQVLNLYGPTEATIWSTSHPVTGADNSIGRPLSNTLVYVLDGRLNPVPAGIPGELCIGGDGVARGYLHRPDLTDERFVPDPFAGDVEARMYRTGDIVRYRPGGELEFIGRRDHQVKVNGFRVELGEVESALADAPGVRTAVVVADDDGRGGKRLVAYVVATDGFDVTQARRLLEERLPRYMVPALFAELPALPLLPSGKVDRKALPDPLAEQRPANSFLAPRTRLEERLAQIWRELLGLPRVAADDNFFELGGDSIIAIQMVSRAKKAGIVLSARDLFQHQTLAELAAVAKEGAGPRAEQGLVLGDAELAPIQRWFFEQELADAHHYNQAVLVDVTTGGLDLDLLARARDAVVRHHDALRNRFVHDTAGVRQWTSAPEEKSEPVEHLDLTDKQQPAWAGVVAAMQARIQGGLDLRNGPLLRMVYIDYGGRRPAQVYTVIHHAVVDGISWRVFMEDLQACYEALRDGRPVLLPLKTTSYKEWAARLQAHAAGDETQAELGYWARQVEPPTAPLPRDRDGANTEATARTVTVELSADETTTLIRDVRAMHRTEAHEVLLHALAEACAPWTGSRSLLVDVEGHGREELFDNVDISRTIGWFTAMYPLRIDSPAGDDGLRAVKEQVRCVPRRGVGFGLLRHLAPDRSVRDLLAQGSQAEIVFNYLGQADASRLPDSMFELSTDSVGASHGAAQRRKHLLSINGIVADGRLRISFTFSEAVHDVETVEALAARFTASVRQVLDDCHTGRLRVDPSAFPDIDLTQEELDDLLEELES
ncbi:non-ribosomal peptide synthetase [Streptomyces alkaliterrae]|uniref:Amino acid adenylation domain-containing protein n=2 Tax=Streptomyces alkaliterrae TaxID=2213162 RepID=A0A5P0YKL4_9ACTN|nr:non-ribosomal peptide synthetase [Streptomyces alkaliterrae]MBB1259198.1 amino acid adenylation domain-containing protein [Streptomyces alkaliterrae]MQS00778.1 amino acid adenylation domain-containing protein [Streptomyces alkaliterrae]